MGFVESFMSFRILCVVQSPPLVFAPNRAFECDPLLAQTPGRTLPVFLVCAGLSGVVILGENDFVSLVVITKKQGVSPAAAVKTVECASRTVEDGGLESF